MRICVGPPEQSDAHGQPAQTHGLVVVVIVETLVHLVPVTELLLVAAIAALGFAAALRTR